MGSETKAWNQPNFASSHFIHFGSIHVAECSNQFLPSSEWFICPSLAIHYFPSPFSRDNGLACMASERLGYTKHLFLWWSGLTWDKNQGGIKAKHMSASIYPD